MSLPDDHACAGLGVQARRGEGGVTWPQNEELCSRRSRLSCGRASRSRDHRSLLPLASPAALVCAIAVGRAWRPAPIPSTWGPMKGCPSQRCAAVGGREQPGHMRSQNTALVGGQSLVEPLNGRQSVQSGPPHRRPGLRLAVPLLVPASPPMQRTVWSLCSPVGALQVLSESYVQGAPVGLPTRFHKAYFHEDKTEVLLRSASGKAVVGRVTKKDVGSGAVGAPALRRPHAGTPGDTRPTEGICGGGQTWPPARPPAELPAFSSPPQRT